MALSLDGGIVEVRAFIRAASYTNGSWIRKRISDLANPP